MRRSRRASSTPRRSTPSIAATCAPSVAATVGLLSPRGSAPGTPHGQRARDDLRVRWGAPAAHSGAPALWRQALLLFTQQYESHVGGYEEVHPRRVAATTTSRVSRWRWVLGRTSRGAWIGDAHVGGMVSIGGSLRRSASVDRCGLGIRGGSSRARRGPTPGAGRRRDVAARRGAAYMPVPGAAQHAAGPLLRDRSIPHHGPPVDQHMPHTDRVVVRILEGGAVGDRGRIEDRDVREHAGAQDAAVQDARRGRRPARSSCGPPPPARAGAGRGRSGPGCAGTCPRRAGATSTRPGGRPRRGRRSRCRTRSAGGPAPDARPPRP